MRFVFTFFYLFPQLLLFLLSASITTTMSAPLLPPQTNNNNNNNNNAPPSLGHSMLPYFKLADGFLNFNHGSFGSTPKVVIDKQREYTDEMEAYPDIWFREKYRTILSGVRKQISDYVHADEDGLVLVENASSGVNSVLRALLLQEGDTILYLSTAYSMVHNILEYLQVREKVGLLKVQIDFPTTANKVVDVVKQAISDHEARKGGKIKVAIFSHITSVPAIILPVEKLVELCHAHGIQVLIDGAHALGSIPLDVGAIGADYCIFPTLQSKVLQSFPKKYF